MDTLQKLFEEQMNKKFKSPIIMAEIIKRQMEKKGVVLSKKQIKKLEKQFKKNKRDEFSFTIDFDDNQCDVLGISKDQENNLDIGDITETLDEIQKEIIANLADSIPKLAKEAALPILSQLRKNAPAMLKEHRKFIKGFEHQLNQDWKKAFDVFEMFIVIAFESGEEVNQEFRKDATQRENYILEVLTRLHARSCQIAYEVMTLLKSGYADGAHARWRSLHEIAVIGSFIKKHDNETAEKYLLHEKIESFKAANLYQKYCKDLGYEPFTQKEYDSIKDEYDKLISRFGKPYKNSYGWAASALNKDDPNFTEIEENSELDHMRPFYKLASHNVHANPKGIMFKLGLLDNSENTLLAGPSNVGFTDPAQSTVMSLGLITITLLTSKPSMDNLIASNILLELEPEIGKEFFKIQKEIEDREATYQSTLHKQEES